MTYPYPVPVAVKTKLRCKFSMPGRKYNCRSMGKFVLNGKGYCAPHYDKTWKVQKIANCWSISNRIAVRRGNWATRLAYAIRNES